MDQMTISPPVKKHKWAAGGVSTYPLTHPIVGQGRFFQTFQKFIHVVEQESERFAHVFAIIAQWGVGKSRLGYELISQINDTSPGWYVRDLAGELVKANLFYDDADREQYLGLYIRYSQVASESHNIDNWFSFGLYKSLLPLARNQFDDSIQGQIAREAYDRLLVKGFDERELAKALEVDRNYSDAELYDDPYLLTRLCQAAYDYISNFGIKYLLIVLDELETVAEAATYGLEVEDIKHLDGRAIKLMGKAIKEEDPRRKLPWLRYVALCSPAIGDELREIKSTARRFELEELAGNSFSDVSDFVKALREKGRLTEEYPQGLVEAAYAMSGGNFGWFNVIMAYVDEVLRARRVQRENERTTNKQSAKEDSLPTIGEIFDMVVQSSSRVRDYVLDYNAINEIRISNREYREVARELLYGQLPVPLAVLNPDVRQAMLSARNEYDEPVATLYRRVEWDEQRCSNALRIAKFERKQEEWVLTGIDQPLDLRQLLANLSTYAIHEAGGVPVIAGKRILLVPLEQKEFIQLISLLYPHSASEDAARALWNAFIGDDKMPVDTATHIGPSIAMLGRLNLRYHRQSHNSLIFRDPDQNAAHESVMEDRREQEPEDRAQEILTGAMRLIDNNWDYNSISAGLSAAPQAIATAQSRRGAPGGLVSADALKLHPDGRLLLAYVRNEKELERLCDEASTQFNDKGRAPVIAFTPSRHLIDIFDSAASPRMKDAHGYLLLHQLTSGEEFILRQIGIPKEDWTGFRLDGPAFSTAFDNRLRSLQRGLMDRVHGWRRWLNEQGRIAWPLKPGGALREDEKQTLFTAWRYLLVEPSKPRPVSSLDENAPADVAELLAVLNKMSITQRAHAMGYEEAERAMLFGSLDDRAEPVFPAFLQTVLNRLLDKKTWTIDAARREWFWGYVWEGSKERDIFLDWMRLACDLGFATEETKTRGSQEYKFRERGQLRNAIDEAENWLQGEYPRIVEEMGVIFGPGKVGEYFNRETGTQTRTARLKIKEAREEVEQLQAREGSLDSRITGEERKQVLIESARLRLSILKKASWVYDRDEYQQLTTDENVHTLNFEAGDVPLWKRIKRAALFAKFVREVEDKIKSRIEELSDEMRARVKNLPGFPVNIFTGSFEKIRNILDGALAPTDPESATQKKQQTEPGTLGHSLKELEVSNARNKLAQLGRELGIDTDSLRETSMEEIEGSIVQGFRRLKNAYEQTINQLAGYKERIHRLETVLRDTPEGFKYPADAPSVDELVFRAEAIEETLQSLNDKDVERLRSEFDAPARLGNFQPLMQEVQRLLEEPKRAIGQIAGHAQTMENVAAKNREQLLRKLDIRGIEDGLNALLQAQGQAQRRPLTLADLEAAGSLRSAMDLCETRRAEWIREGEKMLEGTGVSFEQWQQIVADLTAGRNPKLDPGRAEELVARGFLVRTYKLGGQSRW